MPDPLDYREPATTDPPKRRAAASSAISVGMAVFVICALVMFLPLLIPLGELAKFVVAPAFMGACIGLSITANAMFDWWRGRDRR